MKTNKNGVKLLAAVAVFAMVFAAFAVAIPTSDAVEDVTPAVPGISFKNALGDVKWNNGTISNSAIGNNISVSYDDANKIYTISGTLANIGSYSELSADNATDLQEAYLATWPDNENIPSHAVVFEFKSSDNKGSFVFWSNADSKMKTETLGSNDDQSLLYVSTSNQSKVYYYVPDGTEIPANSTEAEFDAFVSGNGITAVTVALDVTLSEDKNAGKGYVAVENGNALGSTIESGTDGADGKWAVDDNKVLTLTNYNGKEYFSGDFNTVVLVGKNTITLENCANALNSASMLIKSVDGVGSLDIVMNSDGNASAIESTTGNIDINGVSVSITMTEDVSEDATTDLSTRAIDAKGSFSIYDGTITIDVAPENLTDAFGINSAGVEVKSSNVNINAGARGINSTGNISIAASTISIKADGLGIRTATTDNTVGLTITNQSKVDVEVFGVNDIDNYGKAYGVSVTGPMAIQTDSVLNTSSMILYGNATNNATVNVDGDFILFDSAKLTNMGTIVNNGTMGIYGEFINAAGEITNNGTISTYNTARNSAAPDKTLTFTEDSKVTTFTVANIMPLADGTFLVKVTTTDKNTEEIVYLGTLVPTAFNADHKLSAYSIDASNDNGVLSIQYNASNTDYPYSVYSSELEFTFDGKAEEGKMTIEDTIVQVVNDQNSNGTISVTSGKMTNKGTVVIGNASTKLVAGGEIVNDGEFTINKDVEMTSGKLSGNDITIVPGVEVKLTGNVDMTFTYSGTYSTTSAGTTTTTSYTNTIDVVGSPKVLIIKAGAEGNYPGFATISGMEGSAATTVTISEGSAIISTNVGKNFNLTVSEGSTLQIVGTVSATEGVVAVQDGATFNYKQTSDRNTFKFGTFNYTISFTKDGYTYYGSLQFALANAVEGTPLTANDDVTINVDTVVKKDVVLTITDGKKLTIGEKAKVSMEDGASFVLGKGSEVNMGVDTTVSGVFKYDGNTVVLDKLTPAAESTLKGVAAAGNNPSSIRAGVTADSGKIIASEGLMDGTVVLSYNTTDKTTAALEVSKDATASIALTDNDKTKTVVDGTLKLSDATIKGEVTGDGSIVVANGKTVTFNSTAVADVVVGNGTDGFDFASVNVKPETGTSTDTFVVKSVAKSGTKDAYVSLTGKILAGTVTTEGNTAIEALDVGSKATVIVPSDSTVTVLGADSSANGLVKIAGTINMKIANDSSTNSYGTLVYQITYADGSYTVYTMLATGVNNANAGDSFTITDNLTIDENMEVPAGVSIIIADGKKLTVADGKYITIGTAITTVGATTGISGTVLLGAGSFVIVYEDATVDMSKAKIVTDSDNTAAKNSQYTVLHQIYATVYGNNTSQSSVANVLVPEIDGYRFLAWTPMVGTGATVGQTDYDADMRASSVQVVFQKVDGITYYVNNVKMNTVGAPVYVDYGSTVTAVADYGYNGTALVNGESYIIVTSEVSTIVGSGVTAGSAVSGDDGMSITDILLIVLVILAAILVVIVALRMMRS